MFVNFYEIIIVNYVVIIWDKMLVYIYVKFVVFEIFDFFEILDSWKFKIVY